MQLERDMELHDFAWRLNRWAFGRYVDAVYAVVAAWAGARQARAFVGARLGAAILVVLTGPAVLGMAERARSIDVSPNHTVGAPAGRVDAFRSALGRYFQGRAAREARAQAGYVVLTARDVVVPVVVTGYTSRPCETDSSPLITAANTSVRLGVIALSRDLLRRYTPSAPFDFGDTVHVSGVGDFIVEDSMSHRWRQRADIWFPTLEQARAFGRRELILTGPYATSGDGVLAWYKRPFQLASAGRVMAGATP